MSSPIDNLANGSPKDAAMELFPSSDQNPDSDSAETAEEEERWPGWPGFCVFRVVVAVMKVGSIIGRKGELIKKMCEETKARIRVLDGPLGNKDRIVLITGKEEPELPLSPAMDATIRVFKRVSGLSESENDGVGAAFCSIRLLVASSQGMSLIGKQGSLIKSMQESTGATIRILNHDELPVYATQDERIAELQGESAKVLKALEAVLGHLRKFLVDQTVLPLFEKSYNTPAPAPLTQEHQVDTWAEKSLLHNSSQPGIPRDYPPSAKNELLFLNRESKLEQRMGASRVPLYNQDSAFSGLRSLGLGRAGGPIVTQVAQTMQIPLTYAEDIIGIGGANIAYIRRNSGAILTVEESRGLADEITVEIKGTSVQVQTAQQLIQEFVSNHKEPVRTSYGLLDADLRSSSYSQLGGSAYSSSSMPTQPYSGGYGSSGLGGYGSYRY